MIYYMLFEKPSGLKLPLCTDNELCTELKSNDCATGVMKKKNVVFFFAVDKST